MLRQARFAGSFYPGQTAALTETLAQICPRGQATSPALGVMVPHAGYIYSGRFAGQVLSAVTVPDRIIMLGPNHTGLGEPAAVYASGSWETPLGEVPIADDLATALLEASPYLAQDTLAHSQEHSLEVQLPLLQTCNPHAAIVPICIGRQSFDQLLSIGQAIAGVIASWPEPVLLLASSDMTHFESASQAAAKDRLALDRVAAVDAAGLYRTVTSHQISMCGVLPTTVMLAAVYELGARRAEIVAYGHSGEITGDDSDVVAYAGAVIPAATA